jgi:hypothetical protein
MFWDDLHPTAAVHTILAHRALALLDGTPGDFDANGMVDAGDLASWKTGFGVSGNAARRQGDADNDHDVDGADFLVWQQQFTSKPTVSRTAVAIPEPAAWLLLTAYGGALLTRRSGFAAVSLERLSDSCSDRHG